MKPIDYWKECLAQSAEECGLKMTDAQLQFMAEGVKGGHECYGMAYHTPENPLARELRDTEAKLKAEREKVACKPCGGNGRIETQGPHHSSNSQCWKCNGEGKHAP